VASLAAMSTVLWATYLSRTQVLLWAKKTKPLSWITPTAAALNIVAVALLLRPLGLRGAALATVIAVIVQAYLTNRAARRLVTVPWRQRSEFFAYVLGGATAGLALLLPASAWATALRLGIAAVGCGAFGATIAAALRSGHESPDALAFVGES
jgi:O-antigen/teichoic acid export membrane protein